MSKIKFAIIMVMCLIMFTGCTEAETKENEKAAETEIETEVTTELDSWFDDAKEFDKLDWPDSEISLSSKIPVPDWSEYGEVGYDIESLFYVQIGYSAVDNFNDYITICRDEYEFNIEQHEEEGFKYYAENEEGFAIELTYNPYDKFVSIKAIRNPETWNKWWETETE